MSAIKVTLLLGATL